MVERRIESSNNYQIIWDKKRKIARAKAIGVLDKTAAVGIMAETEKIAKDHGDQINWLIDLRQMNKATSKARKILVKASSHPSIRRYAFFGASTFIRVVANFIISAAGQKNARHFANEKDAINWIKEDVNHGNK